MFPCSTLLRTYDPVTYTAQFTHKNLFTFKKKKNVLSTKAHEFCLEKGKKKYYYFLNKNEIKTRKNFCANFFFFC